ncbi:MAG: PAS domain S-box protein [Melioribacteraceae bacterium]|nr:PAS domain S-box protein [Melioribacteraceae bacterium]
MGEKEIHAEILQIKKYSWVISIVWLFVIIGSIFWNLYNKNLHLNEMAKLEAISSFSRDNAIREWASRHGGVYVQMDKEVLPNLGLSHISDRNIIKPNGDTLSLLNPEFMIRQMFNTVNEEYGLFGRTVSLHPLNQNNTPDEWEKRALLNFEKGEKEVFEFTTINGKNYLRLIRPMFIKQSCLKCHASQGYKVGDISGGVSIAVSMDRIQQTAHSWKQNIALLHSILFLLVFVGIRFGEKRFIRGVHIRKKMEGELIEKEIRYQTLFEESPTPLWEEDFSEIKIKLDQLKKDGITDFRKYFDENPEKVIEFVTMVKILRINKAVIELHEANSKEAVLQGLQSIFTEESLLAFIEELIAIANGSLRFEFEASVKTLKGRKKYIYLKWLALPGYEDTLERIYITTIDITERKLREEEIRKSKENLAIAQKIAKVGSWEWDLISNKMTISDELISIYGIDKNREVSLDEHGQFIHKEDKPIVEKAMSLIFTDSPLPPLEYRIVLKDGTIKNILGLAEKVFDTEGNLIKVLGTVQDITERKRAEKVRKENEDALNEAQRIANIGHWKLDIVNNKLSWSDEIFRIFNIEPQQFEATYKAFLNNIHPDDRDFVDKAYTDSLVNKTEFDIVHRLLLNDGSIKYVNEKCRTEFDDEGHPIVSIGTIQDITERTTSEAQIIKLTNAIEQSINSIMITDIKGNIEYINKYFTEVTGYSKEDVIGKNPRFLKTGFLDKKTYEKMWKTLASGNTWTGEFYNRKKNGEYFWEKATISPIKDSNGTIINYVAVKEDITEWKKTEDERLHLEKLVKSSINEIYIFDKETYKFTFLNDAALKNIGYSFEELKLMTPIDIKPEFTIEKFKELVEPLVSREEQYVKIQTIHQRKDKTIYHVDISLLIVEHGNIEKFAAIIIDITKRKKVEDEIIKHKEHLEELVNDRTTLLKESEETFRTLAENSDDTIIRFNRDCKHLYVNPKVTEETGIPAAEFIGKTHENLGFPKELCDLWEDAILNVFNTKRKSKIDFMLPNKSWIDWTLLPELGDDGEVNAVITFGRDITERKNNENRIKESLLKEQELNKIKDQFMSTVSHDLRTPLTAILSSVELMERFYDKFDKEQIMKKYGQIKNSVSRITDMLSHVLELSRIERGKIKVNFTTFNLKKEFQTIIDEVNSIKNETHQLIYTYKLEKEEYEVDINLLREILINLLVNGIKYSPNGGRVELLVEQDDNWLFMQVSDEGMGISENEIGDIFSDFYRTEGSQNISGSGLGLSIVKHYIEMYKGTIEVESTLGEGSVFRVKIPLNNNG